MLRDANNGAIPWADGVDGTAILTSTWEPTGIIDIVVRSNGYASSLKQFDGAERQHLLEGNGSVTLSPGKIIELHLNFPDGMIWPKGAVPEVYFDSCNKQVWATKQPSSHKYFPDFDSNMLNVKSGESGKFSFRITRDEPAFDVFIHIPGFLQCFSAGPFKASDIKDGALAIDVPKPANLEVNFDPGSGDDKTRDFKSPIYRIMEKVPNARLNIVLLEDTPATKPLRLYDFSPGEYIVYLDTTPANPTSLQLNEFDPGSFSDWKKVTLQAGLKEKIDFKYVPFDPNAFHGDRTALIQFEAFNGKPAEGRQVKVDYVDPHYNFVPVFSGLVPENGEVTISNLNASPALHVGVCNNPDPYLVWIDGQQLGHFGFRGSKQTEHFEFRCPAQAGDVVPDIELLNLTNGKTIHLSDFRGKIMLLDFWATWCGPCQDALQKLDKEVAEHMDDWKDQLVVIPISIDDEAKTAEPHFANRGWSHLHTYWSGADGKVGWQAPALQAFGSHTIPTGVLIDREGKIIWLGNPANDEHAKQLRMNIEKALGQ